MRACMRELIHYVCNDVYSLHQTYDGRCPLFDFCFIRRQPPLWHTIKFKVAAIIECLIYIQGVPGGKINILGGHSIGHSKQKYLYEHVSYSERFPR